MILAVDPLGNEDRQFNEGWRRCRGVLGRDIVGRA
jgi:hypothetical protein